MKGIRYLPIAYLCFVLLCATAGCNKGEQIIERPIGLFNVSTFTIDTFQFRVVFNGALVVDSLRTPIASATSAVELTDTVGTLVVTDLRTNTVVVNETLKVNIGAISLSIVQFSSGEKPALAPIPNEPPPAPGNCKVRFTYFKPISPSVPFFDSIQCLLRNNALGSAPFDTIVLKQFESSQFYETRVGARFSMIIYNPSDGSLIHNGSSANLSTSQLSGFNTASVFGVGPGTLTGTYNFQIRKIY